MKFNEILSGMIGFLSVALMSGEATSLAGQAVLFLIGGGLMLAAFLVWKLPSKGDHKVGDSASDVESVQDATQEKEDLNGKES